MPKIVITGGGKIKCISKHLRRYLDNKDDADEVVRHLFLDPILHKLAYDIIEKARVRWINTPLELRSDEGNITPFARELSGLRLKYRDVLLLFTYLRRATSRNIRYSFANKTEYRGKPIDIQRIPATGFVYLYDGLRIEYKELTKEVTYEKVSED